MGHVLTLGGMLAVPQVLEAPDTVLVSLVEGSLVALPAPPAAWLAQQSPGSLVPLHQVLRVSFLFLCSLMAVRCCLLSLACLSTWGPYQMDSLLFSPP